jgi:hypothetical protein
VCLVRGKLHSRHGDEIDPKKLQESLAFDISETLWVTHAPRFFGVQSTPAKSNSDWPDNSPLANPFESLLLLAHFFQDDDP